jgi:hypothetical protein
MVKRRIPFNSARAQSPFPLKKVSLIWWPAACSFIVQQANNVTPCRPSLSHETLWSLGIVVPDQPEVLNHAGKGTVV